MKLYTRHNCLTGYNEAIPEDIIAAFNDLPKWTQARVWANWFEKHGGEDTTIQFWRECADRWEREDAEKAKEAAEVEAASKAIYADLMAVWTDELPDDLAYRLAKLGYRKQADDE